MDAVWSNVDGRWTKKPVRQESFLNKKRERSKEHEKIYLVVSCGSFSLDFIYTVEPSSLLTS